MMIIMIIMIYIDDSFIYIYIYIDLHRYIDLIHRRMMTMRKQSETWFEQILMCKDETSELQQRTLQRL